MCYCYICVFFFVCVFLIFCCFFFFFKQKTAYEMRISDWSSDVCSSDLLLVCRVCFINCSIVVAGFFSVAIIFFLVPRASNGEDGCVLNRTLVDRKSVV